jgi:hypothetical protein
MKMQQMFSAPNTVSPDTAHVKMLSVSQDAADLQRA